MDEPKEVSECLIGERNYTHFPSMNSFTERVLVAGDKPKGMKRFFFQLTVKVAHNAQTGEDMMAQDTIEFDADTPIAAAALMPKVMAEAAKRMCEEFNKKRLRQKIVLPGQFNGSKHNGKGRF